MILCQLSCKTSPMLNKRLQLARSDPELVDFCLNNMTRARCICQSKWKHELGGRLRETTTEIQDHSSVITHLRHPDLPLIHALYVHSLISFTGIFTDRKGANLQPEFIMLRPFPSGGTLKRSVLTHVHLHILQTEEVRRFTCNTQSKQTPY